MKTKLASLAILTALMIPVAAGAADMPLKAPPPPPPPPPFSWNGFYIGGDFGGAWANGTISDSLFGLSVSSNHSGFLGGGEVGYNYQTSNIVFGVEANFDWTSLSATGDGFPTRLGILQGSAKTDWITTVAGRLGVTADRVFYGGGGGSGGVLFYVKGGGGWVQNSATITNLTNGLSASASNNNSGWLVGGGIEWAFAQSWSAKIEYDYLGLRSFSWNSVLFPAETFNASRNIQTLKVGLNYRLNWGSPVVGRY